MRPEPERPIIPRRSEQVIGPGFKAIQKGFRQNLNLQIVIIHPSGFTLDVTHRLSDDFAAVEEIIEIDFTELLHGDITLDLDDRDGIVRRFLAEAKSSQLWTIHIDRETGRRRPKWERVFAGVLDLPWSLDVDTNTDVVSLQVFSFTKLLEQTSAETVQTNPVQMSGDAAIGVATITGIAPNPQDNLRVGDTIKMDDGEVDETKAVLTIDSTSQITCDSNFSNAFDSGILTNESPWYRNRSISFLVGELFNLAGITSFSIDSGNSTPTRPGAIKSVVDAGNDFHGSADHLNEFEWNARLVSSDLDLFKNGVFFTELRGGVFTIITKGHVDWSPENNTIWYSSESTSGSVPFGLRFRSLDTLTQNSPLDPDGSTQDPLDNRWLGDCRMLAPIGLLAYKSLEGNNNDTELLLYEQPDIKTILPPSNFPINSAIITVPAKLRVVTLRASHNLVAGIYGVSGPSSTRVRVWDVSNVLNWVQVLDVEVDSGHTDSDAENILTSYVDQEKPVFIGYANGSYFKIVGDPPVKSDLNIAGLGTATPPGYILDRDGNVEIQTPEATVSVYRATTLDGDFIKISENPNVFIDWHPFGLLDSVPFANFSGKSVAQALKELAIVSASYMTVDIHKLGKFIKRNITNPKLVAEIDAPIEQVTKPIFEFFRDAVEVKGEDEDGNKFEFTAGDAGLSGKKESITSAFAQSQGAARDVATEYFIFLNVNRQEENIVIDEPEFLLRVLDFVGMAGRKYVIIEAVTELIKRSQTLRMLEVF